MLIFFSGSVKWTTGKDYTIRNTQRFARQRLWKNSRSCKGISFFESNMILGNISFFFLIFFSPFFRLWVAVVHLRMVPIKLVRCTYLSLKNWTSSDYNFQFHEKMSLTKYYPSFHFLNSKISSVNLNFQLF